MALGRPVNEDTQYKVIVHTLGKHRYASTKVHTIGEDGKKQYSYKHWGTLEDGERFHPGTNYFYAPVTERSKLIFPSGWDLSEVSELSSTRRGGRVSYQEDDIDRQYGATWLLDKVAEATGVKDDLLKVLGGNNEMVNDVLTMAYFPFIENLSYNQLNQWQKEVKASSEHELNSVNITRLTQGITEKNRMDLFRCRARRVGKDELCVVYSLTSHMPIYYRELSGNMPDCRTVELIMKELEHAGFKNLELYVSKAKPVTRKRGRPAKPKVENQELQVYEIEKLRKENHTNTH